MTDAKPSFTYTDGFRFGFGLWLAGLVVLGTAFLVYEHGMPAVREWLAR